MSADLDPIAVLRRTDPAAGRPVPAAPPLDELVTLPAGPPAPPARHRPVALVTASVLVVLLAAAAIALVAGDERVSDDGVAISWGPTSPAVVALDGAPDPLPLDEPEPAAETLRALADRAEADREPLPTDRVAYQRTAGWTSVTTDGGGVVRAGEQTETWTAPGRPISATAKVLALTPPGGGLATVVLPQVPGQRSDPPFGEDAVSDDLGETTTPSGRYHGPLWSTLEQATITLARPLTGPDRAALLRDLATTGLQYRGEVVDRVGRSGIAVSAGSQRSSGRWELVVVLDPESGDLLAVEEVGPALGDQRQNAVDDEREVTTSTTVLTAAWVAHDGDRPS